MDERTWTNRTLAAGETLRADGISITREPSCPMVLVSGALQPAMDAIAPGAPLLGLGEMTADGPFAIRIARDRAFLVNGPARIAVGWHGDGFAVSAADGLYACLTVIGPASMDLLSEGTSAPIGAGSPSAAIQFAGCPALLIGVDGGWRLWIEPPALPYMSSWLHAVMGLSQSEVEAR